MDNLFEGQQSFKNLVETNFPEVFSVVQTSDTFHSAWKELTGLPSKGNNNPNWRDCLLYIDKVIQCGLFERFPCPILPVVARVEKDLRDSVGQSEYWLLMKEVCEVYRYFVKKKVKSPKPKIDKLFSGGAIKSFGNDYEGLLCSLS